MTGVRPPALTAAVAAIVLGLVCACSSATPAGGASNASHARSTGSIDGSPGSAPGSATDPSWLLTRRALAEVSVDGAARRRLGGEVVDELLAPGQRPLPGAPAHAVVVFPSAGELVDAIRGHTLPPGTAAVLYDPEAWSFTPASEQRDPVRAAAQAAGVAHRHGLRFIVAPALDLTTVLARGLTGSRAHAFLRLGLAARLARTADAVELQAQSLERSPAAYGSFVARGAAQARSADPGVTVLAGLSTNPSGPPVSGDELTRDVAATRSTAAGYWLNVPGRGSRCPRCNPARPDIAVRLVASPRPR